VECAASGAGGSLGCLQRSVAIEQNDTNPELAVYVGISHIGNRRLASARVAVAMLVAYGCAAERSDSTAVVTDSAGVEIVESTGFSWPEGHGWRLGGEPTFDIGILEGDPAYEFFRIAGARRLTDGRVVVADAGTSEIRYYDSSGSHLLSIGGEGGGPGEFGGIWSITSTPEDTLLVVDWRNRRISYFDPSGALARSLQPRFLGESGGFPMIVAPFEDGTVLTGVRTYFGPGEFATGLSRDQIVYVRSDPDGALMDTLAVRPGGEMHGMAQEDRRIVGGRPFGRNPQYAVFGNGFFHGSSDSYEIEFIDNTGKLIRSLRRPVPSMEVTSADIQAYKQEQIENAGDERQRQINQTLLDAVTFPDVFPAYSSFLTDAEGNLWIAVYRRPGDDQPRWTVFGPDGRALGEVQTRERFRIFQIGADFVLGRWTDDLDVQHVLMFELLKQ
jgi:hypothetical protein